MRQDNKELQRRIDAFIERKTAEHPDIQVYARDVRQLKDAGR